MTLRRRLILLHSAFAIFSILAALATILGVQVYAERAAEPVDAMVRQAQLIEDLRIDLKTLDVHLHELVAGRRVLDEAFEEQRQSVLARLEEAARFSGGGTQATAEACAVIRLLASRLEQTTDECVELVADGRSGDASALFKLDIETDLLAELDRNLRRLRGAVNARRVEASALLFERNTRLLFSSLLVALAGVGLVVAGAIVVRRRLVAPIARLKEATEAFASGDLRHRVEINLRDELGVLAESLNAMAASLRVSQDKFRSLFQNQRDAVIVCDERGMVVEIYEGDRLLPEAPATTSVGRHVGDVWRSGRGADDFWNGIFDRVRTRHAAVRISELPLTGPDDVLRHVDVVAYPVNYEDAPYVALVFRDAAERLRLQAELRRADTMEAAVTVARGIAHDFKNLLHSAVMTLSALRDEVDEADVQERAGRALAACEQAASLSRRLSRFAGSDRGSPERLPLAETVGLVVEALDESFDKVVTVERQFESGCDVFIDRDHLTQIILNLLVNAREAMPDGGVLRVGVTCGMATDPRAGTLEKRYAMLSVQDSGCGIPDAERERIFQPFFTSKERTGHGPRGLGLAVVYALVNNAGGFIELDSAVGRGTTFRIHLPFADDAAD